MRKLTAAYCLISGASMAFVWIAYFFTGTVMGSAPSQQGLAQHIAAELIAAVATVAAGAGLLMRKTWSEGMFFLGMGMTVYAMVNALGLYPPGGPLLPAMLYPSVLVAVAFTLGALIAPGRFFGRG